MLNRLAFCAFLTTAIVALCASQAQPKQSDFDEYVSHIQAQGMSESAQSSIRTVASILSGSTILSFVRDGQSKRFGRTYSSAICPLPNADKEDFAEWSKQMHRKTDSLVALFKTTADADSSGFVSSTEAGRFCKLVEFAIGYRQIRDQIGDDREAIASGLMITVDELEPTKREFVNLYNRVIQRGIADFPSLD